MLSHKSYSCGRGTHRVFIFNNSVLPISEGYMLTYRDDTYSLDLKSCSFFERILAWFEIKRLKSSGYFWDSTNDIKNTMNVHFLKNEIEVAIENI